MWAGMASCSQVSKLTPANHSLLSAFHAQDGTRYWVLTEADRSATTLLLPQEY